MPAIPLHGAAVRQWGLGTSGIRARVTSLKVSIYVVCKRAMRLNAPPPPGRSPRGQCQAGGQGELIVSLLPWSQRHQRGCIYIAYKQLDAGCFGCVGEPLAAGKCSRLSRHTPWPVRSDVTVCNDHMPLLAAWWVKWYQGRAGHTQHRHSGWAASTLDWWAVVPGRPRSPSLPSNTVELGGTTLVTRVNPVALTANAQAVWWAVWFAGRSIHPCHQPKGPLLATS